MREQKKKEVTFYSAFFPFYGFILADYSLVPLFTLLNLIVLTTVLFLVLKLSKVPETGKVVKKSILPAFLASIGADVMALIFRFLPLLAEMVLRLFGAWGAANHLAKYWSDFAWYEIWRPDNGRGMLWTILSILVAGIFAFIFNYFFALKKAIPDKKLRRRTAIFLAVFSAPYTWTNPAW